MLVSLSAMIALPPIRSLAWDNPSPHPHRDCSRSSIAYLSACAKSAAFILFATYLSTVEPPSAILYFCPGFGYVLRLVGAALLISHLPTAACHITFDNIAHFLLCPKKPTVWQLVWGNIYYASFAILRASDRSGARSSTMSVSSQIWWQPGRLRSSLKSTLLCAHATIHHNLKSIKHYIRNQNKNRKRARYPILPLLLSLN